MPDPDELTPDVPDEDPLDLSEPLDDIPGDSEPEEIAPEPPSEPEAPVSSFRDVLAGKGIDLSGYQDDNAAIEHIARQIQESQQVRQQADSLSEMAKYGQQYLQNAGEFQQWKAQEAAKVAQPEVDPYAPPDMNPAWLNQVERNEQGGLSPINGGTPETAAKVEKYLQWKHEFDANPFPYIERIADKRARDMAKPLIAEEMGKMREQLTAEMFVTNNRSWLFDDGKFDANGSPQLSERGDAFRGYLTEGTNLGLTGQAAQNLAMSRLNQWDQLQHFKTTTGESAPVDKKDDFLTKAAGFGTNHDASTNTKSTASPEKQASQNENQSLNDAMRAALKSAKITDEDISGLLV